VDIQDSGLPEAMGMALALPARLAEIFALCSGLELFPLLQPVK
jgi:hypothetical protein